MTTPQKSKTPGKLHHEASASASTSLGSTIKSYAQLKRPAQGHRDVACLDLSIGGAARRQKTPESSTKKSTTSLKLPSSSDKGTFYSQKTSFLAKKHPGAPGSKPTVKQTPSAPDK